MGDWVADITLRGESRFVLGLDIVTLIVVHRGRGWQGTLYGANSHELKNSYPSKEAAQSALVKLACKKLTETLRVLEAK